MNEEAEDGAGDDDEFKLHTIDFDARLHSRETVDVS